VSAFVIILYLRSLISIWINVIKVAFYHGSLALFKQEADKAWPWGAQGEHPEPLGALSHIC